MTTGPLLDTDDLIPKIYQGTIEPSPWQSFLRSLRLRLNCDVAAMSLRPARLGVKSFTVWDRRVPLSAREAQVAATDHALLADLDLLGAALQHPGDIYVLDELIDRDELRRSEYYRKLMRPYNVEYQLGMYFCEPKGWACHIGIMNGPERCNFGVSEKQFFLAFRPHLEYALQIYSDLKRSELEKEIYGETLDRLTIGTIILNAHGKVIEINRVAQKIVENSDGIQLLQNQILPTKPQDRAELNRLIKDAIASRAHIAMERYVGALRVESGTSSLGLIVRAAPTTTWHQGESSPCAILYLDDLGQRGLVQEQFVARLFGLTPSEAQLATLLANGFTLAEAASQLNIAENSARTYSKKIFAKTGVNRQTELVRLILKSVALLSDIDQRALHPHVA
jgi:DNA-binding CsgD family transcriptional regulator